MLRLSSLLVIFLFSKAFAYEVVVTKENINYNEIITNNMIYKAKVSKIKKHCIPISYENFEKNKLQAKHYMKKGFIICEDDIKTYKKKSVLFDFGVIQIEKEGEIIYENGEYIRMKKPNGDIEKIYKDGRIR